MWYRMTIEAKIWPNFQKHSKKAERPNKHAAKPLLKTAKLWPQKREVPNLDAY